MVPDQPGTYVLLLRLSELAAIEVGRLGHFEFPAGWYAYVGSARGPGGLATRLSRHRRSSKALHWHIDYLRAHAQPVTAWYAVGGRRRECAWAQALSGLPDASDPAPGFGSSDCHCPTHLFHFLAPPDVSAFDRVVKESISEEAFDA